MKLKINDRVWLFVRLLTACEVLAILNPGFAVAQDFGVPQPLALALLLSDGSEDTSAPGGLTAPIESIASADSAVNGTEGVEKPAADAKGADAKGADDAKAADDAKDTKTADPAALQKRIDQLEKAEKKRTEAEKKKKEDDAKKKEDDAKKKEDDAKKAEDWVDMSTDKWTVKLGGHVQLDYINWLNADPAIPNTNDYFEFRRLRLNADGVGYGVYDFRLQMTLEPDTALRDTVPPPTDIASTPQVKDAYFSINEIPGIGRLRIGNFFVPFSLEQVTNDTNNIFLERSIPVQSSLFSGDREVGIAAYNCTEDKKITWTTGAFFDSVSESSKRTIDDNQGLRLSGRATWLPYYDEMSSGRYLVHTGAGILYTDDRDNSVRFSSRPQVHQGPNIINSGALPANSFTTGNLEFASVWGPVAVQSEAFLSQVDLTNASPQSLHGGYAHVSYFLTGENRIFERFGQHGAQFGRNVPYTNVFATPGGGGWGGWELKARYSNLNLNQVNAGVYNDLTMGVNWYWSDRVRMMFDYIHPVTSSTAVFGATNSDLIGTRFDFNW